MKRRNAKDNSQSSKKAKGGSKGVRLHLHPDLPTCPFVDSFMEVNVFLLQGVGENKMCGHNVPISVSLVLADAPTKPLDTTVSGGPVLETEPANLLIDQTGQLSLKVKIRELSMNRANKSFRLVVKPREDANAPFTIDTYMSKPIQVVRYQLKMLNNPPDVWFKDQGGRDNCIEFRLRLIGESGTVVRNRQVPIRMSLLYEDGSRAINEKEILKVSPDTKMVIGSDGTGHVRVRIEDVSRNHQSKSFVFRVEPDTCQSPLHFDVSSDTSTPVLVRSKRNKQKSKAKRDSVVAKMEPGMPLGTGVFPTLSGSGTNPPSVLPTGSSMNNSATGPNAQAIKAAMWCDYVKDALCKLQQNSMQRNIIEKQLFSLLMQYDTSIRQFLQPQIGDLSGGGVNAASGADKSKNGKPLSETSSQQRRIAARPSLDPAESFARMAQQFSVGTSLGVFPFPFNSANQALATQSTGNLLSAMAATTSNPAQSLGGMPSSSTASSSRRPPNSSSRGSVVMSPSSLLSPTPKSLGTSDTLNPVDQLQYQQSTASIIPEDFYRQNSLYIPGQAFTAFPTEIVDDDVDEDECLDSSVYYILRTSVGNQFRASSSLVSRSVSGDALEFGYPAFDKAGALVGFYFLRESNGHSSVGYKSVDDFNREGQLSTEVVNHLQTQLTMAKHGGSSLIASIVECQPSTGYHLANSVMRGNK